MAITFNQAQLLNTSTNSNSFTVSSFARRAGELYLLACHAGAGSSGTQHTASIPGWDLLISPNFSSGSNQRRLCLLRRMPTSDETSSLAGTWSGGVGTAQYTLATVLWFKDVDQSGDNGAGAIVQVKVNTQSNGESLSVAMTDFADPVNHAIYLAVGIDAQNGNTVSPEVGSALSQIYAFGTTFPTVGLWTGAALGEDPSPGVVWSNFRSAGAVAIEIKAALVAPAGSPLPHYARRRRAV